MMNVGRVTLGSARWRRERRLRSMLRHERMSVATALAEKLHHSPCRSVTLKEELVEHVQYNAPRGQKTASGREAEFFDVFDEELGGGRPPPLPEVAGPQARVLRCTVEPIIESLVPVFLCRRWWTSCRKSSSSSSHCLLLPSRSKKCPRSLLRTPSRSERRAPQLAKQLVEVPVPSFSTCAIATSSAEEGIMALARDATGRTLFHVRGPRGAYWWLSGSRHVQWPPPEGITASPGRCTNTGHR